MKFNVSGFTNIGTQRELNQDRILIQDTVSADGADYVQEIEDCFCFVADGIGGGPAGDYAAQFVLEQIALRISPDTKYSNDELLNIFLSINMSLLQKQCRSIVQYYIMCHSQYLYIIYSLRNVVSCVSARGSYELIESGKNNIEYLGSGTTLVGIIIHQDSFKVLSAGDSPAYVFRNNSMIKITEDHVLNPFEENSPITSYFGGKNDELQLSFETVLREIKVDDILLLASDGLLKALSIKQVKAILSNSKPVDEKAGFILKKTLDAGAEDNISCILIEIIE